MPHDEEELMGVEETLGDYIKDLEVSEDNINEQMMRQASTYVWYARLAALAKRKLARKDLEVKRFEAIKGKELRITAIAIGEKPTAASLSEDVRSTLEWKLLAEELIELRGNLDLLEAIKEGMYQRKGMLEELARSLRREWSGDAVVKELTSAYKAKKAQVVR